jgi:hypothetical protein
MRLPLDHPTPNRPHRVYVAITNHCNRACPWCSTCSSPDGRTFLSLQSFRAALPESGQFQLQLEGGEPTIHPDFWEFVRAAREHPRCERLIICTNGVVLPRQPHRLRLWLARLGTPLTLKISFNHHLLDRDAGLLDLCRLLRDQFTEPGADRLLVINVRLRRGCEEDDVRVRRAIEATDLSNHANLFFLQAYGFAKEEPGWLPPSPVADNFTLVNPDGAIFGPDLIARSEGMRLLP